MYPSGTYLEEKNGNIWKYYKRHPLKGFLGYIFFSLEWEVGILGGATSFLKHLSNENYKVKSVHILHF